MRCDDVARGVAVLDPLEGDIEDAPLVSVEPADAPLLLPVLGVALLAPDVPLELLDESFDMLLGALLLGEVLLDASGEVPVLGDVLLLGVLLGAGGVRFTSPPEEFVTVPLGDAALLRTQSVVIVELDAAPLVDADMPLVLDADVPVADVRAAAESAAVSGGVVPVPLAPFVLFRPVNRWSGFVAVLFAESLAAPVVDVELGLIVVEEE